MLFIFLIITILFNRVAATLTDLQTGVFNTAVTYLDLPVTVGGGVLGTDTMINIKFMTTASRITYTLVQCSFTSQPAGPRIPSNYYGKNPEDFNDIDLYAARLGKDQYINLPIPSPAPANIFITAFNLDPSTDRFSFNYALQTKSSTTYKCATCQNGGTPKGSNTCQCDCRDGYKGIDCSITIHSMGSGQKFEGSASQDQFYYFKFDKQYGKVQFKVESVSKSDLKIYFQYKKFSDEVAGYLDAYDSGITVSYDLDSIKTYLSVIDILSANDLLMTITRTTPGTTSYSVYLQSTSSTTSSVNILLIVLLILGAIIAIIICSLIFFIIYKFTNRSEQILVADHQPQQSINEKLSSNEINMYFPEFVENKLMVLNMEVSALSLKQQKKKQQAVEDGERDCVICLCPVQPSQPARMTYCNHTFHSMCLINWFKKQRNCPYCRQQFSRQNTSKLYKQLVARNGNKVLQGDKIVKAIMAKKYQQSSVKKISVHNIQ